MSILTTADEIINGERRKDYGDVLPSFTQIIGYWNVYLTAKLGIPVNLEAEDQANMMILMKVARASNGYHMDSYIDVAGYAGCCELIKNERETAAKPSQSVTPPWNSGEAPVMVFTKSGKLWRNKDVAWQGGKNACGRNTYLETGELDKACVVCWELV